MSDLPEDTDDDGESIACPWCAAKHSDLWDYDFGNRESIRFDCHSCGNPIELTRSISVDYTASAVAPEVHR